MMNRRHFAALVGALASGPLEANEPEAAKGPESTLLHVAWMRFKPEISAERIEEHLAARRTLPGKIPVLRSLICGRNVTDRAGGMTHGIIVAMRDLKALDEYHNPSNV